MVEIKGEKEFFDTLAGCTLSDERELYQEDPETEVLSRYEVIYGLSRNRF